LDDGGPKAVMRSRQKSQTPRHQLLKLLKRLVCTVRARDHVHKCRETHSAVVTRLLVITSAGKCAQYIR